MYFYVNLFGKKVGAHDPAKLRQVRIEQLTEGEAVDGEGSGAPGFRVPSAWRSDCLPKNGDRFAAASAQSFFSSS